MNRGRCNSAVGARESRPRCLVRSRIFTTRLRGCWIGHDRYDDGCLLRAPLQCLPAVACPTQAGVIRSTVILPFAPCRRTWRRCGFALLHLAFPERGWCFAGRNHELRRAPVWSWRKKLYSPRATYPVRLRGLAPEVLVGDRGHEHK